MKTVAIIPARRGSVRIPCKNWRPFHGKPIIQYSIEVAQRSRLFDHIIVSTDGDEIASVAKSAGAWVYRRAEDCGERGTQAVAAEVLSQVADVSVACVIYPTAPMLTEHDLWAGFSSMGGGYAVASKYGSCLDIGWMYWGPAYAFGAVPLMPAFMTLVPIGMDRAIDINTPEDWAKAEQMYAKWRGL